jgi:hypothetical protein
MREPMRLLLFLFVEKIVTVENLVFWVEISHLPLPTIANLCQGVIQSPVFMVPNQVIVELAADSRQPPQRYRWLCAAAANAKDAVRSKIPGGSPLERKPELKLLK